MSDRAKTVQVCFSDDAHAVLTGIAAARGMTLAALIREAINLEKWWHDTIASGGRILVERDGTFVEVEAIGGGK